MTYQILCRVCNDTVKGNELGLIEVDVQHGEDNLWVEVGDDVHEYIHKKCLNDAVEDYKKDVSNNIRLLNKLSKASDKGTILICPKGHESKFYRLSSPTMMCGYCLQSYKKTEWRKYISKKGKK